MPAVVYPYRATEAMVKNIIDFDPSIENLLPFIDAANQLVTELCAPVSTYDVRRLTTIECYLAAHFLAIRDPRYVSETIGAASATYMQQTGPNLGLTPYGQTVRVLDTSGGISRIDFHVAQGKRSTVGITWLGKRNAVANYGASWRFYGLFE
jgi:hypothetical protein